SCYPSDLCSNSTGLLCILEALSSTRRSAYVHTSTICEVDLLAHLSQVVNQPLEIGQRCRTVDGCRADIESVYQEELENNNMSRGAALSALTHCADSRVLNMAAPFSRVYQPLWRIVSTTAINKVVRNISSARQQWSAQNVKTAVARSPWVLHGAVCLERLPIVSQDRSPIEEEFFELMHQVEIENSLLADHEVRMKENQEKLLRHQKEDSLSDDEEDAGKSDLLSIHDQEDLWEQNLNRFQPAMRSKGEDDKNLNSLERCLADTLILLVKTELGNEKHWLLPQIEWLAGETLRQTAGRALASLPGADLKATFLGNAPCGFYKYKYPKNIRIEDRIGAKVFFFKAVLSSHKYFPLEKDALIWVKKDELQEFLEPDYLKHVQRFIMAQ
ncbi:hypothetical protein DNTS_028170, partial [Danionella cerebrum]